MRKTKDFILIIKTLEANMKNFNLTRTSNEYQRKSGLDGYRMVTDGDILATRL